MKRRPIALLLAGAVALAACGALDPYPTAPRPVPGAAPAQRVAICYNTLTTPLAAVQAEAQQECANNNPRTVAEPTDTDWYMQNCPLLLPARANFICAAKK
jgi:hypothetical protein